MEKDFNNQNLTKKERYEIRQEQKKREKSSQTQKKTIKKILIFGIPAILIIGGLTFGLMNYGLGRGGGNLSKGAPKIEVDSLEYDFGRVFMDAGLLKKTFEIKNTGEGVLKIEDIWTSCHCTTVILEVGGKRSPEFGMEKSLFPWSQEIAPGQTGSLEVIFDPAYHGPEGRGPAVREIYLSTNDPKNKKVKITLLAIVEKD